jgi:hypothetical protein
MITLLALPVAIFVVEVVKPIVSGVDYLGIGSSAMLFRMALGAFVCYRGLFIAYGLWADNSTAVPWWFLGRELAKYLAVLPLSILFGRIVFTYIPPWDPVIGCVLFPLLAIFFLKDLGLNQADASEQTQFRRGARQLTLAEAEAKVRALPPGPDPPLKWAGFELPSNIQGHFCVVGGTGAGKTLMIRGMMASILPHILPDTDRRAIVYDVKLDTISHLNDMNIKCPIIISNPFDTRSWAWNISRDLSDPGTADQYAGILFPQIEGDAKANYFIGAAQNLVGGVLKAFIIARKPWTLRDLIHVTSSENRLRDVLLSSRFTRDLISRYFEPKDTFKNTLGTIANVMVKLEGVAAIWYFTPPERHFSLDEWAHNKSSILVLGRQFDRSETLTLLNQIIFRRVSELLLSGPESPKRWKTWIFLDELQEAGKLDGLRQLLTDGRSKGVRLGLGFQDIEGLRNAYGEHLANTLPAMCSNLSILRLSSSITAKWASDQIGEVENFEFTTNMGTSRDKDGNVSTSRSVNQTIQERRAILTSEIFSFALAQDGNVFGCHCIAELGGFVARISHHEYHEARPNEDFDKRTNIDEMLLPPWTKGDADRLGIPYTDEPDSEEQAAADQKLPKVSALDTLGRLTRED